MKYMHIKKDQITKKLRETKTFVSEASKPPAGARISKGPVGPLKF